MNELDQGSIIFGLRSDKYKETPCYGVVITASCDLYNRKVNKVYYICSLNVEDWLCSKDGYEIIMKSAKDDYFNKIKTIANKNGLNEQLLDSFSYEDYSKVIESQVENKTDKNNLLVYFKNYLKIKSASKKDEKLIQIRENKKSVIGKLNEIIKDKHLQFYYLPLQTTTSKINSNLGFILDFQEIDYMPLEEALKISNVGLDGLLLSDKEINILNHRYWLNCKNDFVLLDGKVESPQREHLLKRFSDYYTRIGLEDSINNTGEKIINLILGENK